MINLFWGMRRGGVRASGWTLIELLLALSAMALMLLIALPSFSALLASQHLTSHANAYLATLHLARSEAIRRNGRVVVCKSPNGEACSASGGWHQGWIVFHDINNNASVDPGEEVLRQFSALAAEMTISGNAPVANYVSYTPLGVTKMTSGAFQAGTLTLCRSGATGAEARQVVVSITGRPRIKKTFLTNCPPAT